MPLSASIVIGTYNRRQILTKTLDSLNQQTVSSSLYEVVVAIDGSTDGTLEAVSRLKTTYELHAIYTENQGTAAAYNLAARHAKNDILILLDDDQRCTPDLVRTHLLAHEGHQQLFVQGFYPVAKEYLKGGASLLYDRTYRFSMAEAQRLQRLGKTWGIWSGNCSLRTETWREVGGLDAEQFGGYGCEDLDLGLRVAALGVAFQFEPKACSFHMHECSPGSLARQAYSVGRAEVALSVKHNGAFSSLTESSVRSTLDAALLWACRYKPRVMRAASQAATAVLWVADQLPFQSVQLLAARIVRKLHKARGTVDELELRVAET